MKLPPKLADLYAQLQEGLDRSDPEQAELALELDDIAEVLEVVAEDKTVTHAVQNSNLLQAGRRNSLLQRGPSSPVVPLRIGPRPDRCKCCGHKL